ncbi:hypothetical protein [Sabulicella glaciei]|uniref:Uncharacterized protein n=1 Tax=Sabulicella glaciei TaxID=2984948 RepID=A0ABT3NUA6_9PROT|nr:hypothetical protein [Roseococcus sp. MDT2-1-1]MCW8085463.1 hypothetical protein [Roseococcus sp. MDT2-1-1]
MPWLLTFFSGLLIGLGAATYSGVMASFAVDWLNVPSREGGAGYFVLFWILAGFVLGTVTGWIVCRVAGRHGVLRGFAMALLAVAAPITITGGLAWAQRDVAPLVAGRLVGLAVEVRLPLGVTPPAEPSLNSYVLLASGRQQNTAMGEILLEEAREEDGHWILPGQVLIHVTAEPRTLGVKVGGGRAQYFETGVPARPRTLDADWGPWRTPFHSIAEGEAPLEARLRLVRHRPPPRPEPPPPPPTPLEQTRPDPDAPTEEWFLRTSYASPAPLKAEALQLVRARPDFVPVLLAQIASTDHEAARRAMYLVGELDPPPAEAGDPIRARAAEVVRLAEAVDAEAEDSRDRLYEAAHVLATGVQAASFGLWRAGVDLRPELRAMAEAVHAREKGPPRDIADRSICIASYFDGLERGVTEPCR